MLTSKPGDRFLLCSDGLSSYVPEDLPQVHTGSVSAPANVIEGLVTAALDHGGPDNVTAAVVDAQDARGSGLG